MMGLNIRCIGVCIAAIAGVAGQASAATFYGVSTNGKLNLFDTTAQTVTFVSNLHIGPTQLNQGFVELTDDGAGNLLGIRSYAGDGGFPPPQFNEVIRITNIAAGNSLLSTSFGPGFLSNVHNGVAFRSSNGSHYAVRNSDGQLGTFNVSSGAFASVAGVAHGSPWYVHALAVNPVDGVAYGLVDNGIPIFGTADFSLIRMNLDTGLSTMVGSLGLGTSAFMQGGLRFDNNGVAYTVNPADGNVYSVSTTTGAATLLFAGGANAVGTTGIAFVPAPGAAGLLLAAAGLVARRRR